MEVYGGNLPPAVIRRLILNSEVPPYPLVFRKIHSEWNPVKFDLETLRSMFTSEEELLPCRVGKINLISEEPQWESQTRTRNLSWNALSTWNSADEWAYFDYKNMTDVVVDEKYLKDFDWARLGFPERDGSRSNLWIGTVGSYTPCHFDTYGCNLVAQVSGRKRWILHPPEETAHLRPSRIPYEESSVYSKINFSYPSYVHLQELTKLNGITVVLEPGDVLFVPPKWWHFVRSEEFSISVNTWVEMPSDVEMRVEEGIVRSLIASFVSVSSPDTVVRLLNPNEEELLDGAEPQIEEFLRSSTTAFFKESKKKDNQKISHENGPTEPLAKKPKIGEANASTKLTQLFEEYGASVKMLSHFDPSTFYGHINYNDNPLEPVSRPSFLEHFLGAVTHPNIVKAITKQFLENLSSLPPEQKENN